MSPRRRWKLAFVFGFWGLRLQIPTGALTLDPAGPRSKFLGTPLTVSI